MQIIVEDCYSYYCVGLFVWYWCGKWQVLIRPVSNEASLKKTHHSSLDLEDHVEVENIKKT